MQVNLFEGGDDATARPAWQVIEAARRRYLTCQLVLGTNPTTNVYLRDGQVYFAERTTDGGLAVRLMVEGVINREQMQRATLQVSGAEHLGRMFDRDDTIDRDAVELCVELMTDDVLTSVAHEDVTTYEVHMYKRHPSGLDRWLPTRVEVITHVVEQPHLADTSAPVAEGEAPRSRPHLTPPPVTGRVDAVPAATLAAAAAPAPEPAAATEPAHAPAAHAPMPFSMSERPAHATATAVMVDDAPAEPATVAETPTIELLAVRPSAGPSDTPASMITGQSPIIPLVAQVPPPKLTTMQLAAMEATAPAAEQVTPALGVPAVAPMAAPITGPTPVFTPASDDAAQLDALVGSNIADEVAEAVRRALAAIDVT